MSSPNETTTPRTEYIHDGYLVDETDRIDLSRLEFDDNDDWLYIPLQCSTRSKIQDLYTWLKMEPELDVQSNKKCIDTRTFTRSKKRSLRMSFESIVEGLSPYVTNLWKSQVRDSTHAEDVEKYLPVTDEREESVPPMLEPSVKTAVSLLSDENCVKSGQKSMEVFLKMSQSKGIDSFINLGEPEFSEPLMNMSQPSLLYASIISSMSDSMTSKNDIVNNDTIAQPIVHNYSNIEESRSNSDSINETFVIHSDDDVSPNETFCPSFLNNTFCKKSAQSDGCLNETYNAMVPGEVSAPSSFEKEKTDALSSIYLTKSNVDTNPAQLQGTASDDIKLLDVTYLSCPVRNIERQDTTVSIENELAIHVKREMDMDVTRDIPSGYSSENESATFLETQGAEDMFFKMPIRSQSTPINPHVMSNPATKLIAKCSNQPQQGLQPALKIPTSLRRELLAEIRRSDEHGLNTTYNHVSGDRPYVDNAKENVQASDIDILPSQNRYNMYKKSMLTTTTTDQCGESTGRKFYTFTKKSNNLIEKTVRNSERTVPKTSVETACRPSMNDTYRKSLLKLPKKNTMLSKLPQFLQKSNPNLVSSTLKTSASVSGSTSIFNVGYVKGSQPDITRNMEKSLPSKLHLIGKLRSGSEQRLVADASVSSAGMFPTKDAIGSTESIESMQSVQSAPDLDDRLSTCSDSSHNSCNRRTMNIEQLHQLVRMQEESLKQDLLPRPNQRILENTWVEAKADKISPILNNGIEHGEVNTNSSLNADLAMKSSSPLISPTGSSHALNNDGNPEGDVTKIKDKIMIAGKTGDSNQTVPKIENKTRLKQPTNWGTGNKPSAVISGIPRPASRIPALRFVKPSTKTAQIDLKKGCT